MLEQDLCRAREEEAIYIATGQGRCDCSHAHCEHDLFGWTTAIVLAGLRDTKLRRGSR